MHHFWSLYYDPGLVINWNALRQSYSVGKLQKVANIASFITIVVDDGSAECTTNRNDNAKWCSYVLVARVHKQRYLEINASN